MKWSLKDPKAGDIIRVQTNNFYHYGIYISDSEVIQFGLPLNTPNVDRSNIKVLSSDINAFIGNNGFLEVATLSFNEKLHARRRPKVIKVARSRIGEGGYDLLYNNCEHFANECVFGKKESSQVDSVRKNMHVPYSFLFISTIKDNLEPITYPYIRIEEIGKCSSESVRNQKIASWNLLRYALKNSFSLNMDNIKFKKTKYGKWICDDCCFSITHTDNFVAIAISKMPIGVDMEEIDGHTLNQKLKEKILTNEERKSITEDIDTLTFLKLWTAKESLFKKQSKGKFSPKNINTINSSTKTITIEENKLLITVACENTKYLTIRNLIK